MIVTVSAWVYLISAVILVGNFSENRGVGQGLAAVLTILLFACVGIGLLRRRNWARWIAIGVSLFTWTVGSLVFVWGVGEVFRVARRMRDVPARLELLLLIAAAVCIALLWLSYKLYKHLTSDEGRAEFDTPDTERNVVLKSTAFYLVFVAFCGIMTVLGMPDVEAEREAARVRAEQARIAARRDGIPSPRDLEAQQLHADRTAPVEPQQESAADRAARDFAERAEATAVSRIASRNPDADVGRIQRRVHELFERRERDHTYTDRQFAADMLEIEEEFSDRR